MKTLLTITMPIHNGETTLPEVFKFLEKQKHKDLVQELILINDASSDQSQNLIENYKKSSSFKTKVISHPKAKGLASSYNEGISLAKTNLIVTMHQDILLQDLESFKKISAPMSDLKTGISFPTLLHPRKIWDSYEFWQKCMFSRFVDKEVRFPTGKFDCFNKILLEEVGLFDSKTFRTAGEDGDLREKIRRRGLRETPGNVAVTHLHSKDKRFSITKLIKKEAQLAEAQGVQLRKSGIRDPKAFLLVFFRQMLLVSLVIPYLQILGALLILGYTYLYTSLVYKTEYKNPRILLLPFVNLAILFIAFAYSIKGFATQKQTL